MVIGTLALLSVLFLVAFEVSRASVPKGDKVLPEQASGGHRARWGDGTDGRTDGLDG